MIRHVDAATDAAACAAIYAPYVQDGPASFEEVPPDAAGLARRIEETCATHPWLVAEHDGRIAGFAYASPHRSRAAYRWAADVTVYIEAAHKRRGVGRALYAELLELLRRQGVYVACAGITLPNDASIGLHEALGFQLVGVYRNIGWKAGAWRDVGWWQRELIAPGGRPADPLAPQAPPLGGA